jgi:hypothetical protein
MDIDLMMRQIRRLIAFVEKYEPMLELMLAQQAEETGQSLTGASSETEPELMTESSDARQVPRMTERQPAADRSEPKTVGPAHGAPVAGAESDRKESKPAGGANMNPASSAKG